MSIEADEIWAILREITQAQKESDRKAEKRSEEAEKRVKEEEKRAKEEEKRAKEVAKEAEKRAKEINKLFEEVAQGIKEIEILQKENESLQKENEKQQKETDKQLKELGKQIGGLGLKFGSFTEGLALPSMTKILREKFHMEVISPSVRVTKNDKNVEIDVLAYANSRINEAYVVEVKSHLREEGISQLKEIMSNFRVFFPEHKDKKVYGIIAAVNVSEDLKKRVLKAGFYLARIQDETFSLDTPKEFKAKAF